MKTAVIILVIIVLSLVFFSCEGDNPVPPGEQPKATLTLEDVSCIEAWIKLSTANISLPADVDLYKGSSLIETFSLSNTDTLLYADSLLPSQTYNFHTIIHPYNHTDQVTSNQLPVTTMDTTSNNFTWQSWTFGGQAGSCNLRDVAIIDENIIWAVGEIYLLDTLGQTFPTFYNLVVWNGNDWQVERVPYYYQGQPFYHPIKSILAFSENDIWLCGNGIINWNGNQYIPISISNSVWGPYEMLNIRGSSRSDLYIAGSNGSIVHYLNYEWSSKESGIDMDLVDIAGTSGDNVFVCGSDINYGRGIILKKTDSGWETLVNSRVLSANELFRPDLYGSISSVWIDEKNTLYAAGNFLYRYKFGKWDYVRSLPENYMGGNPGVYYRGYIGDVEGTKSNDMWIAGDRNTLRHFNGVSWKQIGLPYSPASDIVWHSVYTRENIIAVVGFKSNSAIVMLIKK